MVGFAIGAVGSQAAGITPPPPTDASFADVVYLAGYETATPATYVDEVGGIGHDNLIVTDGIAAAGTRAVNLSPAHPTRAIDHDDSLLLAGDFTWEFWLRTPTHESDFVILSNGAGGPSDYGIELRNTWDGEEAALSFLISDDGSAYDLVSSLAAGYAAYSFDGNWAHVAICRGSGTLRIFVDGEMIAKGSSTKDQVDNNDPTGIGGIVGSMSERTSGQVDEMRITASARYTDDGGFAVPARPLPRTGP